MNFYFDERLIDFLINSFLKLNYYKFKDDEKQDYQAFILLIMRYYMITCDNYNFKSWEKRLRSLNPTNTVLNYMQYYKIFLFALDCNYKNFTEELNKWQPVIEYSSIHWAIKKASLLFLIDSEAAKTIIDSIKEKIKIAPSHERIYYYESLSYYEFAFNFKKNKNIEQKIKELEKKGYLTVQKISEYLLKEKPSQIDPFGLKRYRYGRTVQMGITSDEQNLKKSFQLTQLYIEAGFPNKIGSVESITKEKWFLCYKRLNKYFPYLALFFSLQYRGNNFENKYLQRIGQEIAYDDKLADCLLDIYEKLKEGFKYYFIEKKDIRSDILHVISEMVIALPYDNWKELFELIWNECHNNPEINIKLLYPDDPSFGLYFWIKKTLPFIRDSNLLTSMLKSLLNPTEKRSVKIDYLFFLTSNQFLQSNKNIFNDTEIQKNINFLIQEVTSDFSLKILGNIYEHLLNKNKKDIIVQLSKSKMLENFVYTNLQQLIYFSNGDKNLQDNIKSILLNHKIWETGISINDKNITKGYGSSECIKLHLIRRSKDYSIGIIWDNNEANSIYAKLKNAFNDIEKYDNASINIAPESFSDIELIKEMRHFLEDEKEQLKRNKDFKEIHQKIQNKYQALSGFINISEGLFSSNSTNVKIALSSFSTLLNDKQIINDLFNEWEILINKIRMFKEPGLELCIEHFSYWLYQFRKQKIIKKQKNVYIDILAIYRKNSLDEYDRPFIEEQMIRIAHVLEYWSIDNEHVSYWNNKKSISRFQNIRNIKYNITICVSGLYFLFDKIF